MSAPGDRRVVYTTGIGRVQRCARCGEEREHCKCHERSEGAAVRSGMPRDGVVRIARDRKGRGGKTVTLITGVPGDDAGLQALAQSFKRLCGSGGTAKDGVIEVQGDHRERLHARLVELGYRVKRVGG